MRADGDRHVGGLDHSELLLAADGRVALGLRVTGHDRFPLLAQVMQIDRVEHEQRPWRMAPNVRQDGLRNGVPARDDHVEFGAAFQQDFSNRPRVWMMQDFDSVLL